MACRLPPSVVRLATLLTLLLADVCVAFTFAACYSHYLIFSARGELLSLVAIAVSGTGMLLYIATVACAVRRADRFVPVALRQARRGRLPHVTADEVARTLEAHDPEAALSKVCAAKGGETARALMLLRRRHASTCCRLRHAVPFYRLARFGWLPAVSARDFAGVVFASLLYAVCAGLATGGFAAHRVALSLRVGEPPELPLLGAAAACLGGACVVTLEWCADLPARLLADELREARAIESAVRAEHAAGAMERRIEAELNTRVEALLAKRSAEGGGGVVRGAMPAVMRLEVASTNQKVDLIYQLARREHPELEA